MSGQHPTIGILAGGGSLPGEIAGAVVKRGGSVHVVAIEGEANPADFPGASVTLVNWGQVGKMLRTFRTNGVEQLVIVGRVKRPDLFRLKTDWGFFRSLPAIFRIVAAGGDDGVLRGVVRFFEGHGLTVVGPADVVPELVIARGPLGSRGIPAGVGPDISLGFSLIHQLGPFDIGQAVVIRNGRVLAIEAAEGSDAMLRRLIDKNPDAGKPSSGLLIKRPKPGQERRVDLPAIGPETVTLAAAAGLSGIVVEAGGALAAQRADLIRRADDAAIFVAGVDDTWLPATTRAATFKPRAITVMSGTAKQRDLKDAELALNTLESLRKTVPSAGVAVNRGYVLAVETGEGRPEFLSRSATLRQWGRQRSRGKSGAMAIGAGETLNEADLQAVAEAGIAVVAIRSQGESATTWPDDLVKAAQKYGIALAIAAPDSKG